MPGPLQDAVARAASTLSAWAEWYAGKNAGRGRAGEGPSRARGRMDLVRTLPRHAARHFSQNGEDGVLKRLFDLFGVTNRFYVEIGAGSGRECNTRWCRERGWSGVMIDRDHENPSLPLYREFVTAENAAPLLAKYGVPREFDLLSVDVDGNDYWIWRAVCEGYRPRVVVVEFNCEIPLEVSVTQPYEPMYVWRGEPNTGQSLLAVKRLGERIGYSVLYASAPNAIMILTSLLPEDHQDVFAHRTWRARHEAHFREQWTRWETELRYLQWVYPES